MRKYLAVFLVVALLFTVISTTTYAQEELVVEQEAELPVNDLVNATPTRSFVVDEKVANRNRIPDALLNSPNLASTPMPGQVPQRAPAATLGNVYGMPAISFGVLTSGTILTQGGSAFYYFPVTAGTWKTTAKMSASTVVDYDLYLYRLNDDYSLSNIAASTYPTGLFDGEQFSGILEAGDYYIEVYAYSGYGSTYPFELTMLSTSSYNAASEPNDNMYDATIMDLPSLPNDFVADDIDSSDDIDFFTFVVESTGEYELTFLNDPENGYKSLRIYEFTPSSINLYNASFNTIYTMYLDAQNEYYIRVTGDVMSASGHVLADTSYEISSRSNAVQSISITMITSDVTLMPWFRTNERGFQAPFQGYFVVEERALVCGNAYDAYGEPVPYAELELVFSCSNPDYPYVYRTGYTDENGAYEIMVGLPIAGGDDWLPSVDGYGYHHAEYAYASFRVSSVTDGDIGVREDVWHVRNVY